MKSIIAAFFIALLLLASVACNEEDRVVERSVSDAYADYVDAVEKMNQSDSFSGSLSLYGQFAMMGMNRENSATSNIKHIFGNGKEIEAEIDAASTESNFKSYFKDGYFYFDDHNESFNDDFKFAMQGEDFLNMTLSMLVTDVLFSEDAVFALDVIENSNGVNMRFEVEQKDMQDVLRALANYEETGGTYSPGEDSAVYTFQDVVVMIQVGKDGHLSDVLLSFYYTAEYDHAGGGGIVDAGLEIGMSVSKVGGVTIDYPDNMSDYPDLGE